MWRAGGKIQDTEERICRITDLRRSDWRRMETTIREFFEGADGFIFHAKIMKELNRCEEKSANAVRSAEAKWLKEKERRDAIAAGSQCDRNANSKQLKEEKVPTTSGAAAPLVEIIFSSGLDLLVKGGMSANNARSFLGKARKSVGDPALITALERCRVAAPIDVRSFLWGVLKHQARTEPKRTTAQQMSWERDQKNLKRIEKEKRDASDE
jgi:uncharacterized protein YdaU (DUF1376 family)